ncbi:MAG: hypothetical protein KY462_06985 [Actinobacteria bacterium]|nr:hypothetical protein [Actinomycetota bacterium]
MSHATAEYVMARAAARLGLLLLVPVAGLAAALRGPRGALTAAGALALTVVWFAAGALPLHWAARRKPAMVGAVALGGSGARLLGLGLAAVALDPVPAVDTPVLAITVAGATVLLLGYEAYVALSHPEFWSLELDRKETA